MPHLLHRLLGFSLLLALFFATGAAPARAATAVVSVYNGQCLQGGSGVARCAALPSQSYEFNAGGTIVSAGLCLTAPSGATAGALPLLAACRGQDDQRWSRDAIDLIKSTSSGLCLRLRSASPSPGVQGPAVIDLASCAHDANRKWRLTGVADAWPPAADGTPSAVVAGSSLSGLETRRLVNWMFAETRLVTTPFCWKKPGYDRGIGIAPSECPAGKVNQNGLCYDPPRDGYGCSATVCSQGCPAGYSSSGALTCHYTGGPTTYSKKPHAIPFGKTSCQKSRFKCGALCYDREDDRAHCRDNYAMKACGICSFQGRWDVTRHSYTRAVGTLPSGCLGNRVKQDGLCYLPARTGFTCTVTTCTQQCAAGTQACGAGCAQNRSTCDASIADMVISPAIVAAGMASAGLGSTALKNVADAVKDARSLAALGADLAQLTRILQSASAEYMAAAETELARIATPAVDEQVAARYPRGSANYRHLAREYAQVNLKAAIADMFQNLAILTVSAIEPTGIVATIDAFSKPACEQHQPMP